MRPTLLFLALLVACSCATAAARKKHKEDGALATTDGSMDTLEPQPVPDPACCQALVPMLPLLGASSLAQLPLPVVILSRDGGVDLTAKKNRVRGSMCVCGSPNGTNYDWIPKVKMGVRGSTSVRDFTRKSYKVDTKAGKVKFLGECCCCCCWWHVRGC